MQTLYTRLQRLHPAHLKSWLGIPTCTSREVPDLTLGSVINQPAYLLR